MGQPVETDADVAVSLAALPTLEAVERLLLESEGRFRTLAENAHDVVYLVRVDPTPRYDYMSPSLTTVLGYDPIDCYRDPEFLFDKIHPKDRGSTQGLHSVLEDLDAVCIRVRHADGSWRWMETQASPIRDEYGNVVGQQGISRDVTEQRDAEAKLDEYAYRLEVLTANLEAATRLRDDLLSVVSHELRTPLTPVIGMVQVFQRRWGSELSPDQSQLLEVISRNADRMLGLVDQLLSVSQCEAGVPFAKPRVVDLRSSVERSIGELADTTDIEIVSGTDVKGLIDPGHLHQILGNLVTNARKYGAGPMVIEIADDDGPSIQVRDHGDGVPGEFVDQLFERFTQASTGDTRTAAGMGLGLYIVRQLAGANDAKITYRHNEPHGACFTLELAAVDQSQATGDAGGRTTVSALAEDPADETDLTTLAHDSLSVGAARRLFDAVSPEEVVDVLLDVVSELGGSVVHADDADDQAIAIDVALGTGPPLFPVGPSGTPARDLLERHLPALAADALRMVALTADRHDGPVADPTTNFRDRVWFQRTVRRSSRRDTVALVSLAECADGTAEVSEAVAAAFATSLRSTLRPDDVVARTDVLEFGIILRETHIEVAAGVVERLRRRWADDAPGPCPLSVVLAPASHPQVLPPTYRHAAQRHPALSSASHD